MLNLILTEPLFAAKPLAPDLTLQVATLLIESKCFSLANIMMKQPNITLRATKLKF